MQNQISAEEAAAAFAEIGQAHAGTGQADSKHKLMHRTETLDYGVVTEGEVWLVLDGEEVHLKRGDIVVQRGTNRTPGAIAPSRWPACSSCCSMAASPPSCKENRHEAQYSQESQP